MNVQNYDTVEEKNIYNKIDNAHSNMQTIEDNKSYKYLEINEDILNPINVGSFSVDENGVNNGSSLITRALWSVQDTASSCFINAQKLYSKMLFEENKKINSNNVAKNPKGLSVKISKSKGYLQKNVNYFQEKSVNKYINNFEAITIKKETCVEYFGYFRAYESGNYTFRIAAPEKGYQLWISNDYALYDFKRDNADINKKDDTNHKDRGTIVNGEKQVVVSLRKDYYYPIRAQFCAGEVNDFTSTMINITSPSGKRINKNENDYKYFVTLTENGQPFYKKLLYYALLRTIDNLKSQYPIYKCIFIERKSSNYDIIINSKLNKPLIYFYQEVPTDVTYESEIKTVSVKKNEELKITPPVGAEITILDAKYGTTEQLYRDDGGNKTFNHTEHKYTHDPYIYKWTTQRWDPENKTHEEKGFLWRRYDGYWDGDDNFVNNSKKSNTTQIKRRKEGLPNNSTGNNHIDHHGLPEKTSYVIQGTLSLKNDADNGTLEVRLESDDYAKWWIGKKTKSTAYNNPKNFTITMQELNDTPFTCKIGNNTSNGYVRCWMRKSLRIYDGIDRHCNRVGCRRWHKKYIDSWTDWAQINTFFTVSHNIVNDWYPRMVTDEKQENRFRKIEPIPTYEKWVPDWVNLPSMVNVTSNVSSKNKGEQLIIPGSDHNTYEDPCPGIDCTSKIKLTTQYKYNEIFDAYDPNKQITNRNIQLNSNGELVFGYDYNNKSNASLISVLENYRKCTEGETCGNFIVLDDNGNISIYYGSPSAPQNDPTQIWTKKLLPDNVKIDELEVNPEWKATNSATWPHDFINPGQKIGYGGKDALTSQNGKFKITFRSDGKLTLIYIKQSYASIKDVNLGIINYTTPNHKAGPKNDQQVYYLYRSNPNDLTGLKFVAETDSTQTPIIKSLAFIPNYFRNIFNFSGYEKKSDTYPLLKDDEINNLLKKSNENQYDINDNYMSYGFSEDKCKTTCQTDDNCEHYFYLNTQTGNRCLIDKKSNSIPISTEKKYDNITSGTMNKKTYTVNTWCGDQDWNQPVSLVNSNDYDDYTINYSKFSDNYKQHCPSDPTIGSYDINNKHTSCLNNAYKTFHCSDENYRALGANVNATYAGQESFVSQCGTVGCITENKIPHLHNIAKNMSKQQDRIDNRYQNTNKIYTDISNNYFVNVEEGENLKYSNDGIPEIYKKNVPSTVRTNTQDVMQQDAKTILVHENTVNTIATISVASLLITAIILAKE